MSNNHNQNQNQNENSDSDNNSFNTGTESSNNNSNNGSTSTNNNSNNSNNSNNTGSGSGTVSGSGSDPSSLTISGIDSEASTITHVTFSQSTVTDKLEVNQEQGTDSDGVEISYTKLVTTDPTDPVQITEDFIGTVEAGYDDSSDPATNDLLNQITLYAGKIKCDSFHQKGTVDDYATLFQAASKIANESKQMQLDVDIDGFNEFGAAADQLSSLFASFTQKLQNVNIINDTNFLKAVLSALQKIFNLSTVFGRFKDTILATSTVKIPASAHKTATLLQGVMGEVNCAMNYISNFVSPDPNHVLPNAALSDADKTVISTAVSTIDSWNTLCEHGVTIALSNNPDVQYLTQTNGNLKNMTNRLHGLTSTLQSKLAGFMQ
jgi:hypothetical protein